MLQRINSNQATSIIRQILVALADLLFPPCCHHCYTPLPVDNHQPFCEQCLKQWRQLIGQPCPRCATHFPLLASHASNCPHCQNDDFSFTCAVSGGSYDTILRTMILQIKHQRNESLTYHLGYQLAQQLHETLRDWPIDAVVPVPLHWTRRLWRGYNQAETLARAIAHVLHKPLRTHWLWRRQQTPRQYTLTAPQRRRNLLRAMQARIPLRFQGQHLLLVDDVMTTGATAEACSRALLAAGAGSVRLALLARALGESARPVAFHTM